jgi:hypothetical protein
VEQRSPAGRHDDVRRRNAGAEVTCFEQADVNPLALDAGQGLPGLPDGILHMTGNPVSLLDPAQLPVDPATCKPVYPHSYLEVNTIFEVARAAGMRTAWADKHPAYEILNGPSGTGIQDLFTPEINSEAPVPGSSNDWTTDNALTMQYDSYKVRAVLNEIDGFDHSGTANVGTPAIFGMNFQTVSTAEKLPASGGLLGHSGVGNDINGNPKPYTSSGLAHAYAGAEAAAVFGVPAGDARVPDVLGIAQHGSVYTGKQGKIAEHGGDDPQDRDVPLLVSGRDSRMVTGGAPWTPRSRRRRSLPRSCRCSASIPIPCRRCGPSTRSPCRCRRSLPAAGSVRWSRPPVRLHATSEAGSSSVSARAARNAPPRAPSTTR